MKKTAPQLQLSEQFHQFIRISKSGRRLSASGKRITRGTIVTYEYVEKLIHEFEINTQTNLRIQLLHRASLRMLQSEKNYWKRFFFRFSNFLYNDKVIMIIMLPAYLK